MKEKILEIVINTENDDDDNIKININNIAISGTGKVLAKQFLAILYNNINFDSIYDAKLITNNGEVYIKNDK